MAKNVLALNLISAACPVFLIFHHFYAASCSREEHVSYSWREEYYHDMPIDHFSFEPDNENSTFVMRYLINDTWWNRQGGPVLFHTSGEGYVEDFAKNTGLMWDWAPQLQAVLIFPEHRYYGKTLPFGNKSHDMPYLSHVSVDQAMADYAILLNWFKTNVTGAASSPVITIGGSYGGMLAAWMRLKYPQLVTGAIASSAPILQLPGGSAPCSSYSEMVTRTYSVSGPGCDKAVKKMWSIFQNKAKTADGLHWLNENFRLCNNSFLTHDQSIEDLLTQIASAWKTMALLDYPYPTNFIVPLPGWPVKEACRYLTDPSGDKDNDTFMLNVQKAAFIYFNYTGDLKCLDLNSLNLGRFDLRVWTFQTCADLILRRCQNATDMFRAYKWSESWFSAACFQAFGVLPRYNWLTMNYGVGRLRLSTNIIFTNGELDPWAGSGVNEKQLEGADPSLVVINIANAAHHYDLRANNPLDTREVIEARIRMKFIVQGWIDAAAYHSGGGNGGAVTAASLATEFKPQPPTTAPPKIEY